ncbi:MAG: 6-phospho-beta-glucosidase [Firmicutes bacterium]|jgi:6-phospho-beta-glucosidase|nr:6-phospho-beta-glucosidase [Bacillota bacterium]MDH7494579.1 6-phospho-beta-glucosidase [Bacillota bacterium]
MPEGPARSDVLKIAVIGGGSSYTPELVDGLIGRAAELPVRHLALVDIPEGGEKLEVVAGLARRMIKRAGLDIEVTAGFDIESAISGASFVITQFRVGGLAARAQDERIPLKYGIVGQETTGPGGFAKALRTIPVALNVARAMERLAPDAWLINFTNPSGIVTEALTRHCNIRCIGLCNVPINMQKTIAACLGVDPRSVKVEFVGLNHLSWARRVVVNGRDVTRAVLSHDLVRKTFDLERMPGLARPGGDITQAPLASGGWEDRRDRDRTVSEEAGHAPGLIDSLGMIPSYYLRYYYFHDVIVEDEMEQLRKGCGTRADQVMAIERELFKRFADPNLHEKPAELSQRGGAWYSEAALACVSAIYNDKDEVHVLNVPSQGAIPDLPEDAVVEVNCLVNGMGARPLAQGPLPYAVRGLVQHVKAYERLTVEAAVKGDVGMAFLALLAHPLVPSASTARALLAEILSANAGYLTQFEKNRAAQEGFC